MALAKRSAPQIIEGTPEEIASRLEGLKNDTKLTLIIPGEELADVIIPDFTDVITTDFVDKTPPRPNMTFAELLAPLQGDFEATGMSEEELGDFIDAEIKAARMERHNTPENHAS